MNEFNLGERPAAAAQAVLPGVALTDGGQPAVIAAPAGEIPLDRLMPGDRVFTRDHGSQPVRWVGRRRFTSADIMRRAVLAPVRVAPASLGHNLPERELRLSPSQRLLVISDEAQDLMGERETLLAARHLTGHPGIARTRPAAITYVQILCDHHEVVMVNGVWMETFQPARDTLAALTPKARMQVQTLFPELAADPEGAGFTPARKTLKRSDARLLGI